MPLRIGILGYGSMAGFHENLIARVRGIELVAVADPTPARRKAAADKGIARVYGSEAELLADREVEAVVVATPSNLHARNVIACARAGKHVMTEKPMALSAAEARAMIAAAKRAGVVFTVFHNRRYDADYLTVRRAVESSLLGRIYTIESRISMWSSPARWGSADWRPWRIEKRYGGGGLYDWGSHLVDQMLQMVPSRAVSVYANLQTGAWAEPGVDDYAKGMVDFANGVTALVEVNYMAKYPLPRWYVVGEKGTLKQDAGTDGKVRFRSGSSDLAQDLKPVAGDPAIIYSTWRDAIAGKGKPAVEPGQVLRAVRLIDAFHRSSATKQAVRLEGRGGRRR
jgi:predicted dehydrogenase